jgi:hypothetical protein
MEYLEALVLDVLFAISLDVVSDEFERSLVSLDGVG